MADEHDPGTAGTAAGSGTKSDSLFNIARGAKAVALLCFLLPFVTVSCAGQPLARITGVQLATGSVPPIGQNNPATGAPAGGAAASQGYSLDIFALGAALLIIAGLVVTFMLARRRAALLAMAFSAIAAVLLIFDVFVRIKGAAEDQLRSGAGAGGGNANPTGPGAEFERQMQQQMEQMAQQISVDPAIGFWLCIVALVAAIVLNNIVRSRRTDL